MISAKIIADSKNEFGDRLTTFVLVFPRIVLAEFNTHRVFSRNSASSRAIPFDRMLKMVSENPFIPIKWMKEHKGMQGTEYFTPEEIAHGEFIEQWLNARDNAVESAKSLSDGIVYSDKIDSGDAPSNETTIGVTKQICNRLLEPFMWHTVIVTASDFENFFALRAHPAAEIHIAKLADLMLEEYNNSTPKQLTAGEWHIPFGDNIDSQRIKDLVIDIDERCVHFTEEQWSQIVSEYKIKIATARCARVSYYNFEGKDDYNADIKLFDQLSTSGHWSPFEHCARAMHGGENEFLVRQTFVDDRTAKIEKGWCGNFKGFIQYRKMFSNENKTDSRVKK